MSWWRPKRQATACTCCHFIVGQRASGHEAYGKCQRCRRCLVHPDPQATRYTVSGPYR